MITIADRLVEAMKKANITQADLHRKTGFSRAAISKWVNGQSDPKDILTLAVILGVTPEWLQTGKESRARGEPIQILASNDDERVAQDGDEAMVLRALRQMTDEQRADILKNAQDIVDSNERLLTQLLARKKA
jgi:transcriptional regulator with XRE-family HTH domain